MKMKVIAVVASALVILFLGAIAFVVLNDIYRGNLPWLQTGLAAFLCSLVGGYAAARMEQTNSTRIGTLSGLTAALVVLLPATVASMISLLGGVALVVVWTVGGGLGAYLTRIWLLRKTS